MSKLEKATYPYEEWRSIKEHAYWGESKHFTAISGADAKAEAANAGITINDKLIDSCLYVFRWNAARTHIIAARVSMHPKTAANIARGSRKYGISHILTETHTV